MIAKKETYTYLGVNFQDVQDYPNKFIKLYWKIFRETTYYIHGEEFSIS